MQHYSTGWGWWSILCWQPEGYVAPSGLHLHGPTWLSPLSGTLRRISSFFTCALCMCFFPLSTVSSMLLGNTEDIRESSSTFWFCRKLEPVSRAYSILMYHPAISIVLSPCHCVTGLICKLTLSRAPERKEEHCFLLVLYPQLIEMRVLLSFPQRWPNIGA